MANLSVSAPEQVPLQEKGLFKSYERKLFSELQLRRETGLAVLVRGQMVKISGASGNFRSPLKFPGRAKRGMGKSSESSRRKASGLKLHCGHDSGVARQILGLAIVFLPSTDTGRGLFVFRFLE